MLYRSMTEAADGYPMVGASARRLGVRKRAQRPRAGWPGGLEPIFDVDVIGGYVHPMKGGMSVAIDEIGALEDHRRPSEFGGTGRDPVFGMPDGDLPAGLRVRQKSGRIEAVGLIEPTTRMPIESYEALLGATRTAWRRILPGT